MKKGLYIRDPLEVNGTLAHLYFSQGHKGKFWRPNNKQGDRFCWVGSSDRVKEKWTKRIAPTELMEWDS